MKKQVNKQAKKASKLAKAENLKKKQTQVITVKNADGDPDTTAEILIQNKIDYTPKVSVIIPVYNVEDYLRECLDSVVNQTLKEIEIICVDDGSTDSSLDVLKEYAKKDKRMTVIRQQNLHAGVARNAGLSQAKGEYIHFLDSDDWLENNLDKIYNIAHAKQVDVLKFKNKIYDNKENRIMENSWINMDGFSNEYTDKILNIKDNPIVIKLPDSPWSGIYKLSYLKKESIRFDNLICANDTAFFIEVVSKGSTYVSKEISLVVYRINNDKSLVGIRHKNFFCQLALYNNINKRIKHLSKKLIAQINARTLVGIGYKIDEYFSKDINIGIKEEIFKQAKHFFTSTDVSCVLSSNIAFIYPVERILFIREMILNSQNYIEYKKNELRSNIIVESKEGKTIKISIIIPVYNVEPYLRQCLDSVLSQTLKEIKVICVDDGSTDSSLEILKEYAAKDKRMTIITQKNAGAAIARNTGILFAKGEFIAFMDSDDLYPDFKTLEYMYKNAKKYNALICGGSLNQIKSGKLIIDSKQFDDGYTFNKNGFINYVDYQYDFGFTRFIYSRQFIYDNNIYFPQYLRYEDPIFLIKAMALAKKFYALKKPTYIYRVEYKPIQWTLKKAQDVVKGITDGLILSKRYGLNKLHYQYSKQKLWSNWLTKNVYNLLEIDDPLLIKMLASVDMQIVKNIDPTYKLPTYQNISKAQISVIIPVYNVEKYLRECLDSVINQTLKDIEIICVNDGSPDNSLAILKEYAAKDSRFVIIDQKNQGLSCSRNNALKVAKGEYFVFLDSDDYLEPNALEIIYNNMTEKQLDMLSYSGINFNNDTKNEKINSYWEFKYLPKDFNYEKFNYKQAQNFITKMAVSSCLTAYKRSMLEKYKITFPEHLCFEDNLFFIKSLLNAKNCGIIKDKLYHRRIHELAITQNWNKHFADYIKISDMVLQFVKSKDVTLFEGYKNSYLQSCVNFYNKFDKKYRKKYAHKLKRLLGKYHYNSKIEINYPRNIFTSYLLFPYYFTAVLFMRRKKDNNKQSAFKHFLYHKVKTDSYTKTYVCGIRVKKKPASIYEFIDKRLATMSKKWEDKFAAITGAQSILAEMLQNTQAEGIAEILDYITKIQENMQKSGNTNRTAIMEQLNKLPEHIAENSIKNKAEITEKIVDIEERLRSCRTEIIEHVDNIKMN